MDTTLLTSEQKYARLELQDNFEQLCTEMRLDLTIGQYTESVNLIADLLANGHNAESIACYLVRRTVILCYVPDLTEALRKFNIAQ